MQADLGAVAQQFLAGLANGAQQGNQAAASQAGETSYPHLTKRNDLHLLLISGLSLSPPNLDASRPQPSLFRCSAHK